MVWAVGYKRGRNADEVRAIFREAGWHAKSWRQPLVTWTADILEFVDSVGHEELLEAMRGRYVPAWLRRVLVREYTELELEREAEIRYGDPAECFQYTCAGRTGGVETPALTTEMMETALASEMLEWQEKKIGYHEANSAHVEGETCFEDIPPLTPIWCAGNCFGLVNSWGAAQWQIGRLTQLVAERIRLQWKPK